MDETTKDLMEIPVEVPDLEIPNAVQNFLMDGRRRFSSISCFDFVPSNYENAYRYLSTFRAADSANGAADWESSWAWQNYSGSRPAVLNSTSHWLRCPDYSLPTMVFNLRSTPAAIMKSKFQPTTTIRIAGPVTMYRPKRDSLRALQSMPS